jgi:hypothetical protein
VPGNTNRENRQLVFALSSNGDDVALLGTVDTTPGYQTWGADHPNCVGGSCPLDLLKAGVSCFREGVDCSGWVDNPARSSIYQCTYDNSGVVISDCFAYGPLFDLTNRVNGQAFGDPASGDLLDAKTSKTVIDDMASQLMTRSGSYDPSASDAPYDRAGSARAGAGAAIGLGLTKTSPTSQSSFLETT